MVSLPTVDVHSTLPDRHNHFQPMSYPRQPDNIKVCPGCGTNLIDTARHCAVCGYVFEELESKSKKGKAARHRAEPSMRVTLNLPVLLGAILLLVSMNIMIVLGMQKRDQTRATVAAEETTATYIATTYVSPTPTATVTRTSPPPTDTPEPKIEYTVVSGDSCLSIVRKFKISYDSLIQKNKQLDCSLLSIGTVLKIPNPTPVPEPSRTTEGTPAP